MIGSLYAGASGASAHTKRMTVVGSNIANVNTTGYKYNRTHFHDFMSTYVTGTDKIGRGTYIPSVQTIQTQGGFEKTEQETDLALDGNGFFTVKSKAGKISYTRDGKFTYDKEGYLVTTDGDYLMVRDVDPKTKESTGKMKRVNILNQIDPPVATKDGVEENTGVNVSANLDSNATPPSVEVDYENVLPEMYNFTSTTTVYDAKGKEHTVTLAYRKLKDQPPQTDPQTGQPVAGTEIKDQWQWMALIDGEDLPSGVPGAKIAVGGGFLQFSPKGRLVQDIPGVMVQQQQQQGQGGQQAPALTQAQAGQPGAIQQQNRFIMQRAQKADPTKPSQVSFTFAGMNPNSPQVIGFRFGKGSNPNDPLDTRSGVDGMTQFSSDFAIHDLNADGFTTGQLEGIYIHDDGTIDGSFNSGRVKQLGRVVLSKFKAQEELTTLGNNRYAESFKSGKPIIDDPGKNGMATVHSKTLEKSNVQLSEQFVNMIEGQRAFQASAKVVTTSDEILADTIQMKR